MKIALLPLDDRPVSVQLPQQVAALHGLELVIPPLETLGHFMRAGDTGLAASWLREQAAQVDAAVINVDALCYGGLIQGRQPHVPLAAALERLSLLTELRADFPRLRILAVSVIMRTTITASNAAQMPFYEAMGEFVQLRSLLPGRPDLQPEFERLQSFLPAELVGEFDAARARNHHINRACLELCSAGVIERLLLLQEDCTPAGPHRAEQRALLQERRALGLADRAFLHPGADEGSAMCLAVLAAQDQPLTYQLCVTNSATFHQPTPFEDRSIARSFLGQARVLGLRRKAAADRLIFLHTPEATDQQIEAGLDTLAQALERHCAVYVGDLDHPNGGDSRLVHALVRRGLLNELSGYAAWNTAGNAIGTLLSMIVPDRPEEAAHEVAFLTRLMDDWWYQTVARPAINAALLDTGHDSVCLDTEGVREAQRLLRQLWETQRPAWMTERPTPELSFPWPRTFEVALDWPQRVGTAAGQNMEEKP
ncbi:DUF4127 family protein [Deinococcus marmoris]|uniref:DUF4127 family protein n=1 Tax=Deinococcus marmoris TaxID=249408 RepID=A0A1U7NVJ6_9DEIO|nr:DUF4127 family protein [Deinococcus marmoris]OLV16939.1 hypothetical protein BOO71_0010351 [Deinococcus marmoris]